ncbi:MAG: leucyl aminopeptidase family protein [Gammaproteobacteria bacterium]|nr:leucyl aminopeptidase family protein [Gammaproteobacteria bacterium]MBU1723202.1 leucyl aminopeptidase family protein [Gammaproteobacteria bacterium]MBU2007227.1 leucyl aminopeptidase family protein [Gammaproteobacteria bacterium]
MFTHAKAITSTAIYPLTNQGWENFRASLTEAERNWLRLNQFKGKAGQSCLLPDAHGGLSKVLVVYDASEGTRWALAGLADTLPAGGYHLECGWNAEERSEAAIGWGLGCYKFNAFRQAENKTPPSLYAGVNTARAEAFIQAVALVRDLVNQPANHMMPQHLAAAAERLANEHSAAFSQLVGDELLQHHYPAVHAVGRASAHAPRMLEINWGESAHPLLTLVGKGVCFDTGGLDIKPSQYMRLMKKDMGGAAHVLGLAKLIMQLQLPVRLRVLIPAVDNAIAGDAFRPGDILATRAGKQVEVDNTDAEGRLILCDALAAAAEQQPDLIVDFATLTGAARVALGTEIPVFFSNNRGVTANLQSVAETSHELIWNLPLHKPYFEQLKSQFADFTNSGGSYGGAITAALFLNEFVPESIPWAHFDVMAWNNRSRPGRPIGGEAMGLFAVYRYFESIYQFKE